ncbi:hypothetical protein BC628DRAFT_1421270 [Trametes gibbosa]|nr:hypothetical protein BC628DRAFT_1421270 [Trametes gibbosa]
MFGMHHLVKLRHSLTYRHRLYYVVRDTTRYLLRHPFVLRDSTLTKNAPGGVLPSPTLWPLQAWRAIDAISREEGMRRMALPTIVLPYGRMMGPMGGPPPPEPGLPRHFGQSDGHQYAAHPKYSVDPNAATPSTAANAAATSTAASPTEAATVSNVEQLNMLNARCKTPIYTLLSHETPVDNALFDMQQNALEQMMHAKRDIQGMTVHIPLRRGRHMRSKFPLDCDGHTEHYTTPTMTSSV